MLYKYVSVWIVAEGSCTVAGKFRIRSVVRFYELMINVNAFPIGISYSGKDANGQLKWTGCENINVETFEKAYKFSHIIASFNKCTNAWVAQ